MKSSHPEGGHSASRIPAISGAMAPGFDEGRTQAPKSLLHSNYCLFHRRRQLQVWRAGPDCPSDSTCCPKVAPILNKLQTAIRISSVVNASPVLLAHFIPAALYRFPGAWIISCNESRHPHLNGCGGIALALFRRMEDCHWNVAELRALRPWSIR